MANVVELDLSSTIKIHPVVNVSRIRKYISQVDSQRKETPKLVIIEGEEEWEVEKILNKRKVQGKDKYLVRWKGFIVEGNTWESKEKLENVQELVKEFEKEYSKNNGEVRRHEKVEKIIGTTNLERGVVS